MCPRFPTQLLRRGARAKGPTRVLLAGSFSIDSPQRPVTTAGDLLARDVAAGWLERAGIAYDLAAGPQDGEGVNWREADPGAYSHVVWVCGPVGQGRKQTAFFKRFERATLIGLDVTMLDHLEPWTPFDAVIERDSSQRSRPDLSLLAPDERAPVVGLCLIQRQRHYAEARHDAAEQAFRRLIDSRPMAVVEIDTVIDPGQPGRRSPQEVAALLGRMDVVLTNRLHGMVLSLKAGVPVVAIDGVPGGAKVTRQARALGWPVVIGVDALSDERLVEAFEGCLSPRGREEADLARRRGIEEAAAVEQEFLAALGVQSPAAG